MQQIIKIIIVDDHKIFRTGLELILNGIANVKVVAAAADGRQLLNILKRQDAHILFMDIKMPDLNGIELTTIVKEKYPEMLVIGLSMFGEVEYFNMMLEAGADGFLLKNTQEQELEAAILAVLDGSPYYSKEFTCTFANSDSRKTSCQVPALSKRELEVLEYICQGLSNHEIAHELNLSIHTVDGHRRNVISKTGVKNAASLVMYAIKNGLIKP